MRVFDAILDILFPSKCISCSREGASVCAPCLSERGTAERPSANWIHPIFDYRDPLVKKSIWALKYEKKRPLARVFADVMYGRILEELSDLILIENFKDPLLVPIPLSRKRLRERGFNQCELIVQELVEMDKGASFEGEARALLKPLDTIHQAEIKDMRKRRENMKDTFAIADESLIAGRNIILIDDVTTTGATLYEARRTLRQAGAKKIIAFTLAH